jgi:DNA-binding YbaB/EbfC family protein
VKLSRSGLTPEHRAGLAAFVGEGFLRTGDRDRLPYAGGKSTPDLLRRKQIQQDAQKLQDELDDMELEGSSADGRASVWLSGNQQPLKVRVSPELAAAGSEATETAVLEALQTAYELSTTTMRERMEALTGGLDLNLPGLGG